ncbi:hypothetical protein CC1G_00615 [Coprinopsis cinerea okayama7|uniref:Uncharacterized protein n=1 Tax=Coprinopsis cinerea (strain Okayama-7 / 130 / ATCC MYA-4618 / FGSC 9003) TaxID=240176 RepID=A8N3J6_COPC7|nr:hypothetical protein CC1G_00615 [Coprinopsis cinerea okayama7\|eukprot:XP_001829436.1 hypothetical protein CC1G_00615 [Coprinopsis cinerea okayama7\
MHLCDKCNLLVPGSDFDFEGHVGWCDGPMDRLCKPLGTVYDSGQNPLQGDRGGMEWTYFRVLHLP